MDIKVPVFPESIEEGSIANWHFKEGDSFQRDEIIVDIETDKVVLEVPALAAGTLTKIIDKVGTIVKANQVIAHYEAGAPKAQTQQSAAPAVETPSQKERPSPEPIASKSSASATVQVSKTNSLATRMGRTGPAARRLAQEQAGRAQQQESAPDSQSRAHPFNAKQESSAARVQKRVPMTRLRASVAKRLVESQHAAAILTTFNEVNMRPVMELRSKYRDEFQRKYDGVRLGFMSFFIKAVCDSLYKFPEVNAHIDGSDIVYCSYQDIGVAVSSPRGLVVPILRDAQAMEIAEIERGIRVYSEKAEQAKLTLEELQGGTFTISNGGVFGSLMSTPIINPPQTAILGMHKIQERPVAVNGEVVVLPMMYLALSYDHRMIDGKTAVQFLVNIKNFLEYPGLNLLGV